jgi:hypothetical protein
MYNHCTPLTDAQEIEGALNLCQRATESINGIAHAHRYELSITNPLATNNKWLSEKKIAKILRYITGNTPQKDCAIYWYIIAVDNNVSTLANLQEELMTAKSHLLARASALAQQKAITQHHVIDELEKTAAHVQGVYDDAYELRNALHEIKTYIISTADYLYQARIKQLEKALWWNHRPTWHQYPVIVHKPDTVVYIQHTNDTKEETCSASTCITQPQSVAPKDPLVAAYENWREEVMYIGG